MAMPRLHRHPRGFTLVEMVMAIVIMGVVAGMVAVFMKHPIDAYFSTARRAALTDVADLAVRRIARDLRSALPNSIGPAVSNSQCVEFIPVKTGARYRADDSSLAFKANESINKFEVLGPVGSQPASQSAAVNDWVVVYNLGAAATSPGSGADAYAGDNVAQVTAVSVTAPPRVTTLTITPKIFPLASGSKRLHVVSASEMSVAYVCDTTAKTLVRRSATVFGHICNGGVATTDALLAKNVTACNFQYSGSDLQRNGLVNLQLQLADQGETVSLQHEVHVNNTP